MPKKDRCEHCTPLQWWCSFSGRQSLQSQWNFGDHNNNNAHPPIGADVGCVLSFIWLQVNWDSLGGIREPAARRMCSCFSSSLLRWTRLLLSRSSMSTMPRAVTLDTSPSSMSSTVLSVWKQTQKLTKVDCYNVAHTVSFHSKFFSWRLYRLWNKTKPNASLLPRDPCECKRARHEAIEKLKLNFSRASFEFCRQTHHVTKSSANAKRTARPLQKY